MPMITNYPQIRRSILLGIPFLVLVCVVFFFAFGYPHLIAGQPRMNPAQPIFFDHELHVREAGMDCLFCHRSAVLGTSAGMPSLQQCMSCHQAIGVGQPEIEKVRSAWQKQAPVEWVRIHRMPDHVLFVHEAHMRVEGVTCATCHGDVGGMRQVTRVRPLHMADCVGCHQQTRASTDCLTCHK